MIASSTDGKLNKIENCYLVISGQKIEFNNLPDISDSKGASYSDEQIMGRSTPFKTYSSSDNRTINLTIRLFTLSAEDRTNNISTLRRIQSAVYPRDITTGGSAYLPPPICKLKCFTLLGQNELCVVLKSYNVSFPADTTWFVGNDSSGSCFPARLEITTTWDVVYKPSELPGQEMILNGGVR